MAKSRDAAKERHWRSVIRRFEASGVGARRFCDREGLSEHRLHWWRRTLRQRDQERARRPRGGGAGSPAAGRAEQGDDTPFHQIGFSFSVGAPIEVVHPRGHVIRVPAIFDGAALGRILAAINAADASGER